MTHPKARRLGLSALGYVVAWAAASAAVWWKNRGISLADQVASSGMFAFGDSVMFLAVACLGSIAPTIYLLGLIDGASRFWSITSRASLLLSCTALLADVMWILPLGAAPPPLATLQMLAPLRVCLVPFFLLLFLPGVFRSTGDSRKRFLIACGMELFAFGFAVVWIGARALR